MKMRMIALGAFLSFSLMLSGCGTATETPAVSAPADEISQSEPEAVYAIIGEASDDPDTFQVLLTNQTAKAITGFAIKSDSEEAYPANMIPAGEVFSADETRQLYFTPAAASEEAVEDSAAEDAFALEPQYDAEVTFEDGTVLSWYAIPFSDMQEGALNLEEDVLYATYVSAETGEAVNTLEAAKQILATLAAPAEETAAAAADTASKQESSSSSEQAASSETSGTKSAGSSSKSTLSSGGSKSSSSSSGSAGTSSGSDSSSSEAASSGSSGSSDSGSGSAESSGSSSSGSSSSDSGSSGGSDDGCVGDDGLVY